MRISIFWVVTILLLVVPVVGQGEEKEFVIGFFEGGQHVPYDMFRDSFRRQLEGMVPEGYRVVFAPDAYRTGVWNRDSSKAAAEALVAHKDLDLVVAVGPWTTEDLLEAGFTRPIVAALRFDPLAEGLVDQSGRPIAENLTVRVAPNRFEQDLGLLAGLKNIKKLGFLYFPSGNDNDRVVERVTGICNRYGIEVVASEGFDNVGTYAYFKAYQSLGKAVDAVYVSSLCGFDGAKTSAFFATVLRDRLPVFAFDGRYAVTKGAFASSVSSTMIGVARYHAYKTVRIIEGEIPADLPIGYERNSFFSFNETTASRCRIDIPEDLRITSDLIEAPPSDDVEQLTLSDAITLALMVNPDYLARTDALRAAGHAAGQAGSGYFPHVYASGKIGHVDDNTVSNYRKGISNTLYRADLTLSQYVLSLPTINAMQLAEMEEQRQEELVDSAGLVLGRAVVVVYLDCLRAQETKTALSDYRLTVDRLVELARARHLLGETDAADMLRWQYERQRATERMVEAESQLGIARSLFNLLLSRPGDTPFELDAEPISEAGFVRQYLELEPHFNTEKKAGRSVQLLIDQALVINPAVRAGAKLVDIARKRLTGNSYRYFPSIGFQARLSIQDELEDSAPWFEEKSTTWGVGAQLDIPLFLGGDRLHERAKLRARLGQTEYRADNVRIEVIRRVRTAAAAFKTSMVNTPIAAQAEESVRQYVEVVAESYSQGDRTLAEMLDATATSLFGRINAINSRYRYFEASARLTAAIGWSIDESGLTPGGTISSYLAAITPDTP